MIIGRELRREEIGKIWTIDRSEVIEHLYYLEGGKLILKPERHDLKGWPTGAAERHTPTLVDCFIRGGWFYGLFDSEKLIAVIVLDNRFIGHAQDQLELKFFHVDNSYRRRGFGRRLIEAAKNEARRRGARRLYISAIPSQNSMDFYLRMGCVITREIDPELFAREPEDIHLECEL